MACTVPHLTLMYEAHVKLCVQAISVFPDKYSTIHTTRATINALQINKSAHQPVAKENAKGLK